MPAAAEVAIVLTGVMAARDRSDLRRPPMNGVRVLS